MKQTKGSFCFKNFYLFVSEAKITFGLFYTYMVFMYLFLGWAGNAAVQTLDLETAVQMMLVCLIIGFSQRIIIPQRNITIPKCLVWGLISVALPIFFSILFQWFAGFPLWAIVVFWGILIWGLFLMTLHLYFKLETETQMLNEQLRKFQSKPEKGERI